MFRRKLLKFLNNSFIDKNKILLIGSNRLSLSEYENKELKTFLVLPEGLARMPSFSRLNNFSCRNFQGY